MPAKTAAIRHSCTRGVSSHPRPLRRRRLHRRPPRRRTPRPQTAPQNTPSGQVHGAVRISHGPSHSDGAAAQPQSESGAHHHSAGPGSGNHRKSAAQSRASPRTRSSFRFFSPVISPRTTSTKPYNSIWASPTSSNAAGNVSTACRPRKTSPRKPNHWSPTTSARSPSTLPRNS